MSICDSMGAWSGRKNSFGSILLLTERIRREVSFVMLLTPTSERLLETFMQ